MWADAHLELSRLLIEEMPIKSPEPEPDRVVFFQRVAVRYVRYLKLFRQLEKVYDQVVHPQKRRAIRPVLDGVMGRVLELKFDMVETEFSEYHYLDDILHDMKLTPVSVTLRPEVIGVIVVSFQTLHSSLSLVQADLEIPIPHYFISEPGKEAQEREAMLMQILKEVHVAPRQEVD